MSSLHALKREKENENIHGNRTQASSAMRAQDQGQPSSSKPKLLYRFGDVKDGQVCAPAIVRRVLEEEGWKEAREGQRWNLFWKSGRFGVGEYDRDRACDQRLNHFAKSGQICTKDSLVRIMRRNKATHGKVYDFVPETFLLPNEYNKFVKAYTETRDDDRELWICKPTDLSRGQKIFVMRDLRELVYDCSSVIQRYVKNPLLVGGYKFDLRIYVLVTSVHPLRVHLFEDGLCRFGTVPYEAHHSNVYAHLTNFAINKNSPTYDTCKEVIGPHNKWTLRRLGEYLRSSGVPMEEVMIKVKALVVLSLINLPAIVPKSSSPTCFELFGFDVILDEKLKPWLLEVNTSPALGVDCFEDEDVKEPLIRDLLSAIEFSGLEHKECGRERRRKRPWSRGAGAEAGARMASAGADGFRLSDAGKYRQIFTFNQKTEDLARELDLARDPVPAVRKVISELRQWKKEALRDVRQGR